MEQQEKGVVTVGRTKVTVAFFFSSRRRHTRFDCDWSSDVCSSDLVRIGRRNYDVGPVVSTHDLVVRCQVSRVLCLVAQELDLRHDIVLLMGKGHTQRDRKSVV